MGKRSKRAAGAWVVALAVAGTTVGCFNGAPPFEPRKVSQGERSLARELEQRQAPPMPTRLDPRFTPPVRNPDGTITRPAAGPTTEPASGPIYRPQDVRRMTLQEVIQRAVANNGDVRVAAYDPAIEQTRIIEAEANFDPTFFMQYITGFADNETPGQLTTNPLTNQTTLTRFSDQTTNEYSAGITQNLPSGGQLQVSQDLRYERDRPRGSVIDPFYTSQLSLQIQQPLLRNFGSGINRARIDIARNNTRISVLDFRKQLEESLFTAEQTYWRLVEAERDVQILEERLQRTENTADLLLRRWGQEVSRVQTSQAATSVQLARQQLVKARSQVVDLSVQLKRLMNDPNLPVAGPEVILPATQPTMEHLNFVDAEQIDAAMDNRFDLTQQLYRIEAAGIVYRVAENNLLPRLDIVGGTGQGGATLGAQGVNSSAEQSWYSQNSFDNLSYSIGLRFEVPIGNRAAKAIMRRSQLQRQQSIDQYQALVVAASAEVRQALIAVDSAWRQMVAGREGRIAAEDQLTALQERENQGEPLTPNFVNLKLQAQEQLAQVQQQEATAVSDYQVAIAQLERAKGTLLRYNNVQMQEEQLPFAYKGGRSLMEVQVPRSRSLYPEAK